MIDIITLEPLSKFHFKASSELEQEFLNSDYLESCISEFLNNESAELNMTLEELNTILALQDFVHFNYLSYNKRGLVFGEKLINRLQDFINKRFRKIYLDRDFS